MTSGTAAAAKSSINSWFTTEVQLMMYGLGDCSQPLAETAALIEEITHEQLKILLHKASDVASMRNARFIGVEDFVFLLRKDKVKLHRFVKFMAFRDRKASLNKNLEDEESLDIDGQPAAKHNKACYDFISTIDQTGELLAVFDEDFVDELKMERALRADLLSRHLDTEKYLEFNKARQTSFYSHRLRSQKFKDWLMLGVNLDVKASSLAIEIMSYLAHETVAQLVDLSLLARRDSERTEDDPFSGALTTNHVNYDCMLGDTSHPNDDLQKILQSPGMQSPSATPTTTHTPSPGFISTLTPATIVPANGASKSKSKKKKDKGSLAGKELISSQALQPDHVREAMRRYRHKIIPFAERSKLPLLSVRSNTMCT